MDGREPADAAMASLEALCHAAHTSITEAQGIIERAAELKAQREAGRSYTDIVRDEERPLIVERLTRITTRLADSGSQWRRDEARALHAEGLSMEAIAEMFGVTRQRVSALLKGPVPEQAPAVDA